MSTMKNLYNQPCSHVIMCPKRNQLAGAKRGAAQKLEKVSKLLPMRWNL